MTVLARGEDAPPSDLLEGFRRAGQNGHEYRGVPFWSWNGDLDPEELRRQIREMAQQGLGGFFMHGRMGLITPYLSDRWMECVNACIDEAGKVGMRPWLYDENGFPSGGAGGRVAQAGEEYVRKVLRMSVEAPEGFEWGPNTVAAFVGEDVQGGFRRLHRISPGAPGQALPDGGRVLHFAYRAGGYVDVLSKKAVRRFIDLTYEHYWQLFGDKFGEEIPGIFTDEPSYGLLPWSFELPDSFLRTKGYDLLDALPGLFYRVDGYEKARYDYWSTVLDMFIEAYPRQIGEWCTEHRIALTGHVAWAETLMGQMTFHGASMPFYEFMHIPGTNHLGVRLMNAMREKQVASVARQLGDKRVLCEVAGGMGWGVTFEELKWATEWQIVLGVNLLCQHMHHYTLHGEAKRDIPPSYSYQQPWWAQYGMVNDYFARLTYMLTQGTRVADILLLHPIDSAWILFDGSEIAGDTDTHGGPELVAYNARQTEFCNSLLSIHRDFDYGDERVISRRGRVEGDRFIVGDAAYRIVVLPEILTIRARTCELLDEYAANGGNVLVIGAPPRFVEGVASEEPARILKGAERVAVPPWPSTFVPAGRHDQPKTWPGTREALRVALDRLSAPSIEIVGCDALEADRIWCQERLLPEGRRLLFAMNLDRELAHAATVRFRGGGGHVALWDPANGETCEMVGAQNADWFGIDLTFEPMQSDLLVLTPADPGGNAASSPGTGVSAAAASEAAAGTREALETSEATGLARSNSRLRRYATESDVSGAACTPGLFSLSCESAPPTVLLRGDWSVELCDHNALTIDECRWAVDGGALGELTSTLDAFSRLRGRLRQDPEAEPEVMLEYAFVVDERVSCDLGAIQLVLESPDLFSILVNGSPVSSGGHGWWKDIAFRKIPIGGCVRPGVNTVRLAGLLTPRTEIESIYLIGDFGVRSHSPTIPGDRRTVRSEGPFSICDRPLILRSGNLDGGTDLTSQRHWFYSGNVRLSQSATLAGDWLQSSRRAGVMLELEPPDAVAVRAIVNGHDAGVRAWRPYQFEVADLLVPGESMITLELFGSCRNLLGPHHHWRGEVLYSGIAFSLSGGGDESEPDFPESTWVDRYCFRRLGLSGTPRLRWSGETI